MERAFVAFIKKIYLSKILEFYPAICNNVEIFDNREFYI